MLVDHNKIAEMSWLGLEQEEIEECGAGPIADGIFTGDEIIPSRLFRTFSNPDYFPFFCKNILNVELLPIQHMVLRELWMHPFPMFIAVRGFGKSFLLALYCMMRMILLHPRRIVVAGSGFRQSKIIFEYMENIWLNAPILRDICKDSKGPRRDVDRCEMTLGASHAIAIPIGTGEKIRGLRAHDVICDEFACMTKDTLINTSCGIMTIENYLNGPLIELLNKDGEYELPEKIYKTLAVDVYKIITRSGYSFKCSEKHKCLTPDGWKLAKDLTKDDYLCFAPKNKFHNQYVKIEDTILDEKLAYLFGLLIAEGVLNNKNYINITNVDKNLIDDLLEQYKYLNPKCYFRKEYEDNRGWKCKECFDFRINNTKFRELLFEFGLDYTNVYNKSIPWSILQSPRSVIIAFLKGLFIGDGSVFLWKDRDRVQPKLGAAYYSVCERLIDEVQILLFNLGYKCNKQSRTSKISDKIQWMLRLNGVDAREFVNELNYKEWIDAANIAYTYEESDDAGVHYWKDKFLAKPYYMGKSCYCGKYDTIEEAKTSIAKFWETHSECIKVKSVELLPEKEILYDFSLPSTHNYCGNCFVQHNSVSEEIFEVVLAGFGSVSSTPISNVKLEAKRKYLIEQGIWNAEQEESFASRVGNQIVISGTAYYRFNHFFKYWKRYCDIIRSEGDEKKLIEVLGDEVNTNFNYKDFTVIRVPYNLVPKGFMDDKLISRAKATIDSTRYLAEYGSCFPEDSHGFFSRRLIEGCVANSKNNIQMPSCGQVDFEIALTGNYNRRYVYGIDPASEVDNFSIVVIELWPDHNRIVYCWTTSSKAHSDKIKNKFTEEKDYYAFCCRKIRELMKTFPTQDIAIDTEGGGRPIREGLHDKDKLQLGELPLWPVINPDKESPTDDEAGLHILHMINFSDANWVSEANGTLRKDFENKVLLFPATSSARVGLALELDAQNKRQFDSLEECIVDVEELKDELATIVHTQTGISMRDRWDTPEVKLAGNKKGRQRKDRYSALLMANMVARWINRAPPKLVSDFVGGFIRDIAQTQARDNERMYRTSPEWFSSFAESEYR